MINKKCFTVIRLMYIKNIYVTFYVEENWNTFTKRGIRKKHVQLCRSISCHNFQYVFNTVHVHETSLMIERKRKMTSNRSSSLSLYETNIFDVRVQCTWRRFVHNPFPNFTFDFHRTNKSWLFFGQHYLCVSKDCPQFRIWQYVVQY